MKGLSHQEVTRLFCRLFEQLVLLGGERNSPARRLFFVTLLMAFALLIRLLIAPLEGGVQYVTFFPAVSVAVVVAGLWPGIFAAALGLIMATYLFWPPYAVIDFSFSRQMVVSNVVFLIDALIVCSSIEAMHRYYRKFVDAEENLRMADSVFKNSAEGIVVTDDQARIVAVNPAFEKITGYTPEEAVGQKISLLRSSHHDPEFYRVIWEALTREGCWQGEIWNRRKNGEVFVEWLTINCVNDSRGRADRYVGVFHDITEAQRRDEQIKHLAFHDALTNLPNRLLLEDRLQHAMERARRDNQRLALAFLDLDHFKAVNDSFGHEVGDLLLKEVSRRIESCVRAADTVARLGGDEFVIVLEEQRADTHYIHFAQELLASISRPMELGGHQLEVGASIGIAFFPQDGADLASLMKRADKAMYAAKAAGRGTFQLSTPSAH